MTLARTRVVTMGLVLSLTAAFLGAQSIGPDVIVGDLTGTQNYGQVGGISAFSVGTTSCNIGNQTLNWFANTNQHPVIAQNMYRLKNGQFEHIGVSWLKHGFAALAGNVCATCNNPGTQTVLGVGCSDPYSSSLNGQQSGLGPRSQVNAFNGFYPYPFTNPPTTPATIGKRLQVKNVDLDAAQNVGAQYIVEGHYVTPDDAAAGNQMNNVSYRTCNIAFNGTNYTLSLTGTTQRQKAAIQAWKDIDPGVQLTTIDVPGDGRLILGAKATAAGGGMTRYEFALYNMNCDRSVQAFDIAIPSGATIANAAFHDVDYHTGDGVTIGTSYDGTDWAFTNNGTSLRWATSTFAMNPNANALRWGSLYNFRFDSNMGPGSITLDLFKSGSPASVSVGTAFPPFSIADPTVPATIAERTSQNVTVSTTNISGAPDAGQAFLYTSIDGGPFVLAPLASLGGGNFQATLPALNCGSQIRWYVSIAPIGGGAAITSPSSAPASFFTTNVDITSATTTFADNFETNMGWTVTNSAGLTAGAWQRGTPVGGGIRGDPAVDADGSGQCWLTGNAAGDSDVDGGSTTVTSPVLNVSGLTGVRANFQFWHDNNFGAAPTAQDAFTIEVSANGTTWVLVESYAQSVDAWVSRSVNVEAFLGPVATFQIRFTSADPAPGSVVESGVDAFSVTGCPTGVGLGALASGNVGLGVGGPFSTLFVNGSDGNAVRRVDVGLSQPISLSVITPPSSMFPALVAVFGFIGTPVMADQTVLPFSVGTMLFPPCPLNPTDPRLFAVGDALGVTASCPPLVPVIPATPWSIVQAAGVPFAAEFTLQGVTTDPSQPTALAVTNAVLLSIAP